MKFSLPDIVGAIFAMLFAFSGYFYILVGKMYKYKLYDSAFEALGFVKSSEYTDLFKSFRLGSSLSPVYKIVYKGNYKGMETWFLFFEVESGGKVPKLFHYNGVLFETGTEHYATEIYDMTSEFKPIFEKSTELESIEFNDTFKVISDHPKNPFYQLSPSAMQSLLKHKEAGGHPVNIQFRSTKALMFSEDTAYKPKFTNVQEFISKTPSPENVKALSDNILKVLEEFHTLYKSIEK